MVDKVTLPGTGEDVATDEIGGRHFQKIKLVVGANDTAKDVTRGQGLPISGADIESLLTDILMELRLLNHHAAIITDSEATIEDMEI